ncbi:signal peptidase I [Croceimicrobium sp.]|uniref:signal peptidase I n=1 Tax=Croceimicrobium sp. TaxID=2828340 RepID=UPI003BAC19B4
MSIGLTLIFLTLLQVYYGVLALRFITGAGYKSWQALLPYYNIYIMTKVIHRPWWWTILAILPVVGNVMMVVIFFELMHMYRIANIINTVLGVITLGLYFGYLGYTSKLKYQDRDIQIIRKYISEGFASIVFAVVAATLIRAYTFEAFTIPTPSMEKSLMVGDFLFVSKLQYGSRLPMTPFSLPLMHNKVPFTEVKSFSDAVTFPYLRLPKISDVKRNDPVVFNYPMEDYYPVDKREHYVKRCLGLPGDQLNIKDGEVYINGETQEMPDRTIKQFQYFVRTQGYLNENHLKEDFDINTTGDATDVIDLRELHTNIVRNYGNRVGQIEIPQGMQDYVVTISDAAIETFKQISNIDTLFVLNHKYLDKSIPSSLQFYYAAYHDNGSQIFPPGNPYHWTRDNFGPIQIPAAGSQVELTINNYHLYKRIIEVYEGHDFKVVSPKQGMSHKFIIDGQEQTHYSFAQDYYWMMGDNRHNSLDSRYWGFVPADHIVGKPVFIWMSYDKYASGMDKIRTDRVFTTVSGDGERRSYFWYFVGVVAAFYGFRYWRNKKKQAA